MLFMRFNTPVHYFALLNLANDIISLIIWHLSNLFVDTVT